MSGHHHRDRSYPQPPLPLNEPVYDNHTHVNPWTAAEAGDMGETPQMGWRQQLDRAAAVGVAGIVQVGCDVESSRWSAARAASEPRMLAAVAIHPTETRRYDGPDAEMPLDEAIAVIDELAAEPRVRAVGESGLDFAFGAGDDPATVKRQTASFEAHIEIAKRRGHALQIHDRDAHREVVETLLRVGAPERTVFHCFSGDAELAAVLASNGWYASFSGTVTFRNAEPLRAALRVMPRELVLVETDAPYLTPHPFRGRLNSPYLVPVTLRSMADTLELGVDELARAVRANTERVYGRWDAGLAPGGAGAAGASPDDGRPA